MNMKNLFLLLVCGLCFQSVGSFAQGYKIQVNIPQMSNKQVILANYFEGKGYAVDTAQINSNGTGYFQKNNKKLARGMNPSRKSGPRSAAALTATASTVGSS